MDEKYNMNDTAPGPQPGAGESATRAQTCAPPDPMPPLREEPPKKVRRAGTFTLGLVLVAAGVLLVLSSVLPSFDMRWGAAPGPGGVHRGWASRCSSTPHGPTSS